MARRWDGGHGQTEMGSVCWTMDFRLFCRDGRIKGRVLEESSGQICVYFGCGVKEEMKWEQVMETGRPIKRLLQ